jgi:hypothetical protein
LREGAFRRDLAGEALAIRMAERVRGKRRASGLLIHIKAER